MLIASNCKGVNMKDYIVIIKEIIGLVAQVPIGPLLLIGLILIIVIFIWRLDNILLALRGTPYLPLINYSEKSSQINTSAQKPHEKE
jgi:hypothetical protein